MRGSTYTPKKGDRVRVTIEGDVSEVSGRGTWFVLGANCIELTPEHRNGATYTVEKLQDPIPPEPEWVNGDVIKVPDDERASKWYICLRVPGGWIAQDGGTVNSPYVSRMWAAGKLDTLFKNAA